MASLKNYSFPKNICLIFSTFFYTIFPTTLNNDDNTKNKVIASEDWKGMREDFKVFSEVVQFTVEYTPKFINPPLVKERGKSPPQPARPGPPGDQRPRPPPPTGYQDQQAQAPMYPYYQGNLAGGRLDREDLASFWGNGGGGGGGSGAQRMPPAGGATPAAPVPPADLDYTIKVGWRLKDVDYPICLDYFELDYYDTTYNSSAYLKRFERPFQRPRFELEVSSLTVPCEPDYDFIARAYGFNKQFSRSHWTPPSCVRSTPPPTTTLAASEDVATVTDSSGEVVTTTESLQEKLDAVQAENDKLQAKIDGLKQEYEKIGLQVFAAFKESFFQGLEDFLARRRTVLPGGHAEGGGPGGVSAANATDPLFGG